MFLRRRADPDDVEATSSTLTRVRDIVEIVAIVIAGIWAIYTFVYENRIKPAYAEPETQIESGLTRLGERKGLIAVRSHVVLKNAGVTDVWLYGIAETVAGSSVRPRRAALRAPSDDGGTDRLEERDWISTPRTPVFAFALLTRLASSQTKAQIDLRPGQSVPFDRVFYVTAGRFDELDTFLSLRYAAHPTPIPYRFRTRDGFVRLDTTGGDDVDGSDGRIATLSLWAR